MKASTETALFPDQVIVDPHHHLRSAPHPLYQVAECMKDVRVGHNIVATVHVECTQYYRTTGPEYLRPVGETEYIASMTNAAIRAAIGFPGLCAGIVGHTDFCLDTGVIDAVLHAHIAVSEGRFRGIRQTAPYDLSPEIGQHVKIKPPLLLRDKAFREGFAKLAPLGLSFDAWVLHPQLNDVLDLARAFPETAIILNHAGGPVGVGNYRGKRDEVFAVWSAGIRAVAAAPNVCIKLGGLGMALGGFGLRERAEPATSVQIAAAWQPYIETCIQAFGPDRCMFESNFPVDNFSCSHTVLWNAFKRLAQRYTRDERQALFAGTAARAYRLSLSALEA